MYIREKMGPVKMIRNKSFIGITTFLKNKHTI